MALSKSGWVNEVFRSLPAGGPHIGSGEKRSAPIGVGVKVLPGTWARRNHTADTRATLAEQV